MQYTKTNPQLQGFALLLIVFEINQTIDSHNYVFKGTLFKFLRIQLNLLLNATLSNLRSIKTTWQ